MTSKSGTLPFRLRAQLVKEKAAPYCVRWVRPFLTRPVSSEPLPDEGRRFCEEPDLASMGNDQSRRADPTSALASAASSGIRLDAQAVIDRAPEPLLTAEVALGGLDGYVPE